MEKQLDINNDEYYPHRLYSEQYQNPTCNNCRQISAQPIQRTTNCNHSPLQSVPYNMRMADNPNYYNRPVTPCDICYPQNNCQCIPNNPSAQYPTENNCSNIPQNYMSDNNENFITDEYLLDYLLKRYKLDKQKLILMLTRSKENEYKFYILNKFYHDHKEIEYKPFRDQYRAFKEWNCNDIHITRDELEDFYETYKKIDKNNY